MNEVGRFQQSEAVLRALIESPQRIVIFALDREYRYLAYNENHARTMKQIWGVRISVGSNMLELIRREDDRKRARENFDRALSGESFTSIEEYGDTRMERRVYEDIYSPVKNLEGQIIGVAVYLTDITEQRRAEMELERYRDHLEELVNQRTRELEAAHAQLLHAQKMESLGVLAGGIAHDFNNLLAVVLARAELCLRDLSDEANTRAHLSIIRDSALEARMLTRQLLSYAGREKFVLQVLNLNQMLESMAQILRASTSKGIRLSFEHLEDPVLVSGDPTQLRQVVLNLVTNAAEAIGEQTGSIQVRTGSCPVTPLLLQRACFPCELPGDRAVYLEVWDSGSGIRDDVRDRLFDPFFTTKFAGRGLGLAAVLGIVKSHQGTILIDTSQGTRFRIVLPAALDPQTPVDLPELQLRADTARAPGCVLVVDDEAEVRSAASEALRALGYRVLQAEGGASAQEIFREHGETVDVVLLDFAMPDANGWQTMHALRAIRADVRIILLTGYAQDECGALFAREDLAGFLAKPFTQAELIDALNRAIVTGAQASNIEEAGA